MLVESDLEEGSTEDGFNNTSNSGLILDEFEELLCLGTHLGGRVVIILVEFDRVFAGILADLLGLGEFFSILEGLQVLGEFFVGSGDVNDSKTVFEEKLRKVLVIWQPDGSEDKGSVLFLSFVVLDLEAFAEFNFNFDSFA